MDQQEVAEKVLETRGALLGRIIAECEALADRISPAGGTNRPSAIRELAEAYGLVTQTFRPGNWA